MCVCVYLSHCRVHCKVHCLFQLLLSCTAFLMLIAGTGDVLGGMRPSGCCGLYCGSGTLELL